MLTGRGFTTVYNLAGGIKAWQGNVAVGDIDLGLELFSGNETAEKSLTVAYSMEQGLREFYLKMLDEIENPEAKKLFHQLADIEILHQDRIYEQFLKITSKTISRDEFEKNIVVTAVEGGLTTEEYINLFEPDLDDVQEVVAVAMSIEAQALDLYQRAAERSRNELSQKVLAQIASEEQVHLKKLGKLMDQIL